MSKQSAGSGAPTWVLVVIDDLGWRDLACYGSHARRIRISGGSPSSC